MRFFPWKRRAERRDSSFTDALVNAIVSRSGGSAQAVPTATGALEACAGLVGRAFASARVDGPSEHSDALTPSLLALVGRALIRTGDLALAIGLRGGRIALTPSDLHDVTGGYDPSTWRYRLHLAGPSTTETRAGVAAENVLHFRYAAEPDRPWVGVGPLQAATLAGRLSASTIGMLADEAGGPRGFLLPTPKDGADDTLEDLKGDIKTLNGSLALVESMTAAFPGGGPAPRSDWMPSRIGANPPAALVEQARLARIEVLAACGVSPALFDATAAAAAREAWRQLLFGVIAPLGRIVEAELRAKLHDGITLAWAELRASDIQGRARAFQSLTGGGMDAGRAAAFVGFDE